MMKFSSCALVLISVTLMLSSHCFAERGAVGSCKLPMVKGPHGKYCYDFQPNPAKLTWVGAQDFCETNGGNLATLHTAEEVKFLVENMAQHNVNDAYLGFRAFKNRTKWLWVDDNSEIDTTVVNWVPGEPNFASGQQNCGHVNIKGILYATVQERKLLDDVSCDIAQERGFVCKIPLTSGKAKNRKYSGRHHDIPSQGYDDVDDDDDGDTEDMDGWF